MEQGDFAARWADSLVQCGPSAGGGPIMMVTAKIMSKPGMRKGFNYYCDKLGRETEIGAGE